MSQYHPLNPTICTLGSPERVGEKKNRYVTIDDIKELRLTYLCTEISGKKLATKYLVYLLLQCCMQNEYTRYMNQHIF
jgi:hypothetical protein